jgi:L-threonylcarbamoyladenylate synthase
MMKTIIGKDISVAAALLKESELVAIPTETVYGLAGNALSEDAVLNIYKAKNRPQFNPLIIHVPSIERMNEYVTEIHPKLWMLAKQFMPGPLTLLLTKKNIIPDLVTAGSDKVAIRIPKHALTQSLLEQIDFPLAAPSANPFGYVSPTSAQHVFDSLHGKIPYILDGGDCRVGLESTIISADENNNIVVHRVGGTAIEEIERSLNEKVIVQKPVHERPDTPGQLKSHYATHTPLFMGDVDDQIKRFEGRKIAVISYSKVYKNAKTFMLSQKKDMNEAAKNLFKTLRLLDKNEFDVILVEEFPNEGLGRAINDRLARAQQENK